MRLTAFLAPLALAAALLASPVGAGTTVSPPTVAALADVAWTAYTPSVTCGQSTGTITCTPTGRYKQIGKTVLVQATVVVTGVFTAGTFSQITVPFTSANQGQQAVFVGRESATGGLAWIGTLPVNSTLLQTNSATNSNTVVTGNQVQLSGVYEVP